VGPRLAQLLFVVFVLFALLGVNAAYLGAVTFAEWLTGRVYQDYFYQLMFLLHLTLGLIFVLPVLVFGVTHWRNARKRPNRRAVRAGYALLAAALALLLSGFALTRLDFFEVKDPGLRGAAYWIHVATPLLAAWLFVLHRLAGPRIRWRLGAGWLAATALFAALMLVLQTQDPRRWNVEGPESGLAYFFPSLARTASGEFIPASALMMDAYCEGCHPDVHRGWAESMHRFSSFNNPAYLFSVRETRRVALERDGDVQASRFCAGCHDPVPFFSGSFDAPDFDDVNDPTARAGITCSACHAITHVNSVRGNADYTIEEPLHYPFATSDSAALQWLNHQLVKAKPTFHQRTFLKPLHREAEFCGTCHKVHLPPELNRYKWLRGQNHYDSYLLSGVSGHGVASFYYPPKAVDNCAECHMPLQASEDFGAADFDESGERKIHDHHFPSANTAIPHLLGRPEWVNDAHRSFLEGALRVDLFGIKEGGAIDGPLHAPLGPEVPTLEPGESYLVEVVIRTLTLGHAFTQGTADSNEVWLEIDAHAGDRSLGRSGAVGADGSVDPWAHFVNATVLDRDGKRIDRRNAQDIFVSLYDHQIPPGAADVVHFRLEVPDDASGPITLEVSLRYRKFDTTFVRHFQGDAFRGNDLPITTLARASLTLPVVGGPPVEPPPAPEFPEWERWNDYGIGLLRKGTSGSSKGELRQAEAAFRRVESLGRAEGALNLGRVYLKEGRLREAAEALARAGSHDPPALPWSLAWFSALVDQQNGYLEEARTRFEALADTRFADARARGFDFSQDVRLLVALGQTLFELAKLERGEAQRVRRAELLAEARSAFERALVIDPEHVSAHFNLSLIHVQLGDDSGAGHHRELHARYKPDDNARDRAVAIHRRENPAANHAAEAIVIYDLRAGADRGPE
jgi:Tfp pilus assembly protein PilF